MTAIFLATEVNEGLDHVVPWTNFLAQALAQGYQIHMAAPDVGVLQQHVAGKLNVQLWSAPKMGALTHRPQGSEPSVRSWCELLASLGYGHPQALLGAVKAWRSILECVRPKVVLADYAPALMLAAWTLDVPILEVGGGFCVPPLGANLSCFPGIQLNNAPGMLPALEQLTWAYNASLDHFGKARIARYSDTQVWPIARVVLSPAELDPYGLRTDVVYAGLLQPIQNDEVDSKRERWPSVIGYLKANTPGLTLLLEQLEEANREALIYVPGAAADVMRAGRHVTVTDKPIEISQALMHADVYLSNGGLSGVGQALQAGCWPILIPQQAEQVATARNLVQRHWASMWLPQLAKNAERGLAGLFAPRPRERRFAGHASAQATLLGLIERIG